jgi:hypothetical protein
MKNKKKTLCIEINPKYTKPPNSNPIKTVLNQYNKSKVRQATAM